MQGLNRIAAVALLFLSEEDSFWCLEAIIQHIMPKEYFTNTLASAQADQVTTPSDSCHIFNFHSGFFTAELSFFFVLSL